MCCFKKRVLQSDAAQAFNAVQGGPRIHRRRLAVHKLNTFNIGDTNKSIFYLLTSMLTVFSTFCTRSRGCYETLQRGFTTSFSRVF